jgi:hypothetical protein
MIVIFVLSIVVIKLVIIPMEFEYLTVEHCCCVQYSDYAVRVLLPKMMIKIVKDMQRLKHYEAENFIFESWFVS